MPKLKDRLVDDEAERRLCGAILTRPACINDLDLDPEEFGSNLCSSVYRTCVNLDARGKWDALAVERESGIEWGILDRLMADCPTTENVGFYADAIRQKALTRRVVTTCKDIQAEGLDGDDLLAMAVERITAIDIPNAASDACSAKDAIKATMDEIHAASQGKREGILTGCELWDEYAWIETGDVMTIAARPSMGKSAVIVWLVRELIGSGHKVLMFLTEGNRRKFMRRMLSQMMKANTRDLRRGKIRDEQAGRIATAVEQINKWPLWIDDSRYLLRDIRRQTRRMKARHGVNVVIVDHLQEVRSGQKGSEYEQMNMVVEGLREMALEAPKAALIQACQLNRECESTPMKQPSVHHLRASGRIEEISDVITLLWRGHRYFPDDPEHSEGEIELNFAKVRDGETGKPTFAWDPARGIMTGPLSKRTKNGV
jgi:replicative DNA helicase